MVSIAVHFHPDWPAAPRAVGAVPDELVIEALLRDGRHRSQFETGTSNGALSAHPGGARWRWESRLFQGRYDAQPAAARPTYGAWADRGGSRGPAIRFGSAHLRLREDVTARSTFCYPDSWLEPDEVVGPAHLGRLTELADRARDGGGLDELDDYVEAHVHGGVDVAHDVEAIVLDPCFRGGRVQAAADALAAGGGARVEWHAGFAVPTADLPEAYRGPAPLALARDLSDLLTPDLLGPAATRGTHDPQTLKQVWHLLARFGRGAGSR